MNWLIKFIYLSALELSIRLKDLFPQEMKKINEDLSGLEVRGIINIVGSSNKFMVIRMLFLRNHC